MSAVAIAFDYAALDTESRIVVQQRTGEIRSLMRTTATGIVDIGAKLIDVKDRLDHGQFESWLQAEFAWSVRTARNFMAVAEQFKTANFADLTIAPSALYLLASPSTPEPARTAILARAEAGEVISHAKAQVIVTEHREEYEAAIRRMLQGVPERLQDHACLDLSRQRTGSAYWPRLKAELNGSGEEDWRALTTAIRAVRQSLAPKVPRSVPPAPTTTGSPKPWSKPVEPRPHPADRPDPAPIRTAPAPAPAWRLKAIIESWAEDLVFDLPARYRVLAALRQHGPKHAYWHTLRERLPQPHRIEDVMSAMDAALTELGDRLQAVQASQAASEPEPASNLEQLVDALEGATVSRVEEFVDRTGNIVGLGLYLENGQLVELRAVQGPRSREHPLPSPVLSWLVER